jgi:glycosyltransferase involved in cell wall biosynthesis
MQVIERYSDPRIKVRANAMNLGFARNLDCAVGMATGDVVILLSSDDLMRPGALARYRAILDAMGPERAARAIIGSTVDVIDASGTKTGAIGADPLLWPSGTTGDGVHSTPGGVLLARCLRTMRNPFSFCSVAWPRALGERIGGYGTSRSLNPDKWLNWRLLALPDVTAHWIDAPLFQYRWHASNQSAQQSISGALKYLTDEYVATFQLDDAALNVAGISRRDFERAFVNWDIARHGLGELGRSGWIKALRTMYFGFACYPWLCLTSKWWWLLAAMVSTGPIGRVVAKMRASRTDRAREASLT